MDHQENYQTSDLPLAAYLLTMKYPLIEVTGDSRRRMFIFPPAARAAAPGYFTGERVVAREFAAALKTLKSALYAAG